MDIEEFSLRQGRYVILGSIDGILAVLGIIIGVSATTSDTKIILAAGLGGAVALALTNGVGSYLAESTVEYGKLARVEEAMLTSLHDTQREAYTIRMIILDALSHGGFSLGGSVVPLLPFLGLTLGYRVWEAAAYSILALVALGVFSGKVSRKSLAASVAKMVAMGVLVAVVTTVIGAAR